MILYSPSVQRDLKKLSVEKMIQLVTLTIFINFIKIKLFESVGNLEYLHKKSSVNNIGQGPLTPLKY